MRPGGSALVALLVLALAGCASGRLIHFNDSPGLLQAFHHAAADGIVGVAVPGVPPEGAEAIARAMEESGGWGPPARFVPLSLAEARAEPHFVVVLDPPPNQAPARLCDGDDPAVGVGNGSLRFQVAFCAHGTRLSEVEAVLARPDTLEDPALARLIGQAMMYLVPVEDPELGDGGDLNP